MHRYGAHLFHTSNPAVWQYVNRFTTFTTYVHRVYTNHKGIVFPLPINLGTINQFFRRCILARTRRGRSSMSLPASSTCRMPRTSRRRASR